MDISRALQLPSPVRLLHSTLQLQDRIGLIPWSRWTTTHTLRHQLFLWTHVRIIQYLHLNLTGWLYLDLYIVQNKQFPLHFSALFLGNDPFRLNTTISKIYFSQKCRWIPEDYRGSSPRTTIDEDWTI